MADFLLSVGVDVGLSYDQMQKDISDLVTQLNQNPQRVRVGLEIDHSAIERFRTEVANIHNSMGGLGRVTVSPVDTGGLNNAIDGIARLAQSTQGAISTVQTMRAELNSVNAEKIQQAIASINGISAEGASALAHSLGEANVRATEVRARLLEAADAEQQLVALQVRGTNEAGHMVNYLMTYNTETSEISRRMVDITARLEDATAAESHRATTVREITDLYRQMHALMRTNTNATNIASYAELANQAQLLQDALALARTESISIDEALTRLGTSGATAIGGARDAMSAFRLEMEQTGSSGSVSLTTMYNTVAQMQTLLNNNAGYANLGTYTNLQTQVNLLVQAIELASNGGMTLEAALNAVGLNGSTAIHNAREAMSAFKAEMSGATAEEERLTMGTANYRTALEKINVLLRQVRANTEKWTAAKTGKSSADYQVYADQARELENLAQRLSTGTITMREFNAEYGRIKSTASGAETAIRASGEATQTWSQRLGGLTAKFGTWFSITRVIMAAYRAVREMVSAVIDLDTAMTELKKVTNETDATYEKFLVNATKRAKTLGAELADTVSATADFARLGFGIADAEKLADAAIVYKNVGDGIDDIGTASESIIATMQAFSIPAEEVMKIVDKFNEVGNNYAISSKGVGDALLRSAAAMNAANNSLDETIALAAAANTIVQDPEKVGTTLKTVSMYLRAAKTEAEEAGESTEGMADSVSELRDEILRLTGNKVDIQIDEDTFKSTYQILQELSQVWGELSDISQANILEMVGGKRNSNVVAALLENFTVAENTMKTSAESAGSALAENEKYLESINGKVQQFKAVFEDLSNNLIGSDIVKFVVDLGSTLLSIVNGVVSVVNALGGLKTILLTVAATVLVAKGGLIAYKAALLGVAAVEKIAAFFISLKNGISNIVHIIPNAIIAWKSYAAGVVSANTAIQASIPVIGLVLAAVSAVVAAISMCSDTMGSNKKTVEELNDEWKDLSETIKTSAENFRTLKTEADEIIPRYAQLSQGVDKYGKNVSLTDDEFSEFVDLNNKLGEMFPDLVRGYDANGNAILALSGNVDTLTSSLYACVEAQRQAAAQEIADTMPDVIKNINETTAAYEEQIKKLKEQKTQLKDFYDHLQNGGTPNKIKRQGGYYDGLTEGERKQFYDDLGVSVEQYEKKTKQPTNNRNKGKGYTTEIKFKYVFDESNLQENYETAELVIDKQIKAIEDKISAKNKQLNPVVSAWLQTDFLYNDLNSTMQGIAETMVAGLDFSALGLKTEKEVQDYITNNIINPLFSAAPDVKKAFETSLQMLQMGLIDADEFKERMKTAFSGLTEGMSESELKNFTNAFISGFNAMGIEGNNFDAVVNGLIEDWTGLAGAADDATDSVNKFRQALSAVQKLENGLEQLDKIYADVFNGEDFDFGSILNNKDFAEAFGGLGDAYDNFIKTVANSPSDINACQDAFNNLAAAYLNNSDVLKDVTDETRNATVAMLKQMGIANAAAIVDYQLAYNKEYLKYTTGEYADMTYEEILALYNECEAGSVTQQILAQLAITKMQTNENGIKTASDIDQLIALANTANATTQSLANLAKAKEMFTRAESLFTQAETTRQNYINTGNQADGKEWQRLFTEASSLRSEAEKLLNAPLDYNKIDSNQFKVKYTGDSSTNSAKSSASKSKSKEETWFEKQLAEHQHLVAMEKETQAEYLAWLSNAYPQAYQEGIIELKDFYKYQEEVFEGLRDIFRDNLGDIEHEISMRENYEGEEKKIISLYKGLMSDVEKEIAKARAQGLTDEDDYIQELQEKWQGYANAIKDIREEIEEAAKDALDEMIDYRVDMLKQEIEDEKDALDKKLDYLKEFYDKQKEMLQDQYDEEKYLEEQSEKRKTVTDLKSELAMLENDDSAWAQKRKLELQEELATAEDDLGDFEDEHALDMALDALDNAYNAQEAQIQAEMDALDERLNDPEALFNQALNDIKTNTGNLYQEMLEYNRKHGTGNDEDVKDKYEDAYKALLEYEDVYGEPYKGIVLPNSTNYKPENGSWDDSKISGTNPDNQPKEEPKKEEPKKEEPKNTAPSLSKGSTITVKKSATHFGSKSNGVRMASFVPGGSYTVYQTSGNQVLIGRNGVYTGWINKSDIVGYAKGTKNATAGLHSLDELGSEYLFTSTDGNKYRVLSSGDKVLNARATDFLYEFANGGGEILEKIIKSAFGTSLFDHIQPVVNHNEIDMGDVIVQGNADNRTVSEIRRAQRDNLTEMLKSLNKLNK